MSLTPYDISKWMALTNDEQQFILSSMSHSDLFLFGQSLERYLKRAGVKSYYYMVTFTLDPSKGPFDETVVEQYISKIAQRKALKLLKFAYVREYTKSGAPHWHACIVTTRCLKKDRFNYYIRMYGNVDISKNKAQTDTEMLEYMSKSGDIVHISV